MAYPSRDAHSDSVTLWATVEAHVGPLSAAPLFIYFPLQTPSTENGFLLHTDIRTSKLSPLRIMSAPQANEAEKNIEIWKVKKLIKRLEAARGNGTSMISLIIRKSWPAKRRTA